MNRRQLFKNTGIAALLAAAGDAFARQQKHAVLNMDGVPDDMGDTFDPEGAHFEEVVPIILNHDPLAVVGTARLTRENKTLFAEFRFNKELNYPKQYAIPAVDGFIDTKVPNDHGGYHIVKCRIKRISLQTAKNADKRIQPLIGRS